MAKRMKIAKLSVWWVVAWGASSCAISRDPEGDAQAAEAMHAESKAEPSVTEPLPEPPHIDHFASRGVCDSSRPWSSGADKLSLYAPGRMDRAPYEVTGMVDSVEVIPLESWGVPRDVSSANYRRVKITSDRGEYNLDMIDVRGLDFRPGMQLQITRADSPGVWGGGDYRTSVRSGDTILIDHIHTERIDHYTLEGGLVLEDSAELCYNERECYGYVHALRVSDARDSVILEPGMTQARSLGDFDIYLWESVFRPSDGPHCIDGPQKDTIDMTFVNRQPKLAAQ